MFDLIFFASPQSIKLKIFSVHCSPFMCRFNLSFCDCGYYFILSYPRSCICTFACRLISMYGSFIVYPKFSCVFHVGYISCKKPCLRLVETMFLTFCGASEGYIRIHAKLEESFPKDARRSMHTQAYMRSILRIRNTSCRTCQRIHNQNSNLWKINQMIGRFVGPAGLEPATR